MWTLFKVWFIQDSSLLGFGLDRFHWCDCAKQFFNPFTLQNVDLKFNDTDLFISVLSIFEILSNMFFPSNHCFLCEYGHTENSKISKFVR